MVFVDIAQGYVLKSLREFSQSLRVRTNKILFLLETHSIYCAVIKGLQ